MYFMLLLTEKKNRIALIPDSYKKLDGRCNLLSCIYLLSRKTLDQVVSVDSDVIGCCVYSLPYLQDTPVLQYSYLVLGYEHLDKNVLPMTAELFLKLRG